MNLLAYLKLHGYALAEAVGTSKAYLSQLAHGHRKPSPKMALSIEMATNGLVTREILRPDIYGIPSPPSKGPAS